MSTTDVSLYVYQCTIAHSLLLGYGFRMEFLPLCFKRSVISVKVFFFLGTFTYLIGSDRHKEGCEKMFGILQKPKLNKQVTCPVHISNCFCWRVTALNALIWLAQNVVLLF